MTALHHLTIAEVGALLRAGDLTAAALVEAYLARIDALDPRLHAYITVDGEAALETARSLDGGARRGHWRGPLHGVPLGIKDVIATAGLRTTCHSRLMLDHVPASDAACVARLKAAGAIVLGKLATHEFAFGGPSFDLPFPPARNPWAPDRVTGGSSSGSGAAVAAGLCAGAVGSDTSGSIRMPAGHCGVVGLKPSYARVSRHGVYPLSFSLDHVGPLAASVRDCAILLDAMAGPHGPASAAHAADATSGLDRALSGLRVGVDRSWYASSACPEMVAAVERALRVLAEDGARVVEIASPSLDDMNACGRIILLSEGYAVHRRQLAERPQDYGKHTRDRMRLGAFIRADQYVDAQRLRRRLIGEMDAVMRQCDVLVTANQYGPAETFAEAGEAFPFFGKPYLTMPFNLTGQPALTVPFASAANGLPLAVQIAGRPFEEDLVLAVGHALEQTRGGLARPPI